MIKDPHQLPTNVALVTYIFIQNVFQNIIIHKYMSSFFLFSFLALFFILFIISLNPLFINLKISSHFSSITLVVMENTSISDFWQHIKDIIWMKLHGISMFLSWVNEDTKESKFTNRFKSLRIFIEFSWWQTMLQSVIRGQ